MDVARQTGFPGLQALALTCLGTAAWQAGDRDDALRLVRQAQDVPGDSAGGLHRALSQFVTMILTEAGDLAGAERACAAGLASCREVGDLANLSGQLWNKVILDLRASRIDDATAHLRELLQVAMQTGRGLASDRPGLLRPPVRGDPAPGRGDHGVGGGGRAQRSLAASVRNQEPGRAGGTPAKCPGTARPGRSAGSRGTRRGHEPGHRSRVRPPARPAQPRAAVTATAAAVAAALPRLSPRERELISLVAQGRTDAEIAAQLYITVRTVSSHLDRIRDKTGCRRRADITRLALGAGLV